MSDESVKQNGISSLPVVLAFFLLALFHPLELGAQEEVIPILHGQLWAGSEPLPGAMVVLHQVSSELSGEIDSIQAAEDGTFTFTLPQLPAHGIQSEVYFASVRYRDLLYFGPAITGPTQLDSLYRIQAFDTLSVSPGGASLTLTQRSLFLNKVEPGWEATDFFQLLQEEDRTLFSPDDGVVWSYPLPESATDFEIGQSDLSPDAFLFTDGRFEVYSPLPPGERFFLVRYRIMEDDFRIPMPGTTKLMQLLVRDPAPEVEFPPLEPAMPVELEPGNIFQSYEGLDMQDSEVQGRVLGDPFEFPAEWLGILLAALLGGIGVWGYRRGSPREADGLRPPESMNRETVVLAIAKLDEDFGKKTEMSDADRDRYQAQRVELLGILKNSS
jgi:hypothetical protein